MIAINGKEYPLIRRFENADLVSLNRWYDLRGQPVVSLSALPSIGYFAEDMAAGFLYQTDSCIAMLDAYVTNPLTYPKDRDQALDEITECLLIDAKDFGFRKVLAFTQVEAVVKRAQRHGLQMIGPMILLSQEI